MEAEVDKRHGMATNTASTQRLIRTVNTTVIVPKITHRFTPEILESFLTLQFRMHEEISMLLNAVQEYSKQHHERHASQMKKREEKRREKKQARIKFVYNFVLQCEGVQLTAALKQSKRVMPLAVMLNTNEFSITRSRDMVGEVNFQNLTIKLEEEEVLNIKRKATTASESANAKKDVIEQITKHYTFGELVTNVHIVQTPEVKSTRPIPLMLASIRLVSYYEQVSSGRVNYMWKHYSFHLDRYTKRSQLHGDMVETVLNASFKRKHSFQRDRKRVKFPVGVAQQALAQTEQLNSEKDNID